VSFDALSGDATDGVMRLVRLVVVRRQLIFFLPPSFLSPEL